MVKLADKVVLVVGGASGIGESIARRLASEGAATFVTGRRQAELDDAVSRIAQGATGIVADAGNPADVARAVESVATAKGRIDVLVFNAAISEASDLLSTTAAFVDRHFALNVRGPLLALQAAVPHMPPGSAVVLVGSTASEMAVPYYGTYAATKAALRSYARTWTQELAPKGIRVNVLSPGPTDTAKMAVVTDDVRAAILGRVPVGRLADVEEIAGAALFLASDDSAFMAGSDLQIDGGMAQV